MKFIKKSIFILIILISIHFVSAIEISLTKDTYSPLETLQAQIKGNFINLKLENIIIYRDNVSGHISVKSGLTKQEDTYYYYAILPKQEGNYSLKIENALYTVEGDLKSDTLVKIFNIIKNNFSSKILTIDPGYIVSSDNFILKVKSPYKTQSVNVIFEGSGEIKNLTLIEDEEKEIYFSIENVSRKKTNIKVGDYNIPVFIIEKPVIPEKKEITFYPNEIKAKVIPNSNYSFRLLLENSGDNNITDIKLSNDLQGIITPSNISKLNRLEKISVNISIPIGKKVKENLSGIVKAEYEGKSSIMKIFLEITNNQSEVNLNGTTINPDVKCKIMGKICVYPETCAGSTTESIDGPCCLGDCVLKKESTNNSNNWIMGIIAIVLLALIFFFLYKKAKRKPKTAEEILKEREKHYEEKIKDSSGKEVKGNLERV
ncbi:MAG: hypothetical protein QXW97_03795 [Candidatus Pacearchaeota archaeon]